MKRPPVILFVLLACVLTRGSGQTPETPLSWFEPNPGWSLAEAVLLPQDASEFQVIGRGSGSILYFTGDPSRDSQLRTLAYIGDCVIRMEFLLTPNARAGLYVQSRYKLVLTPAEMGALGPLQKTKDAEEATGVVAPLLNAAGEPGTWQTLEVKFRAPRNDEARNQIQPPLIIEAKINGKLVHAHVMPQGRSAGSEYDWDDAGGPSSIGVEEGSLALRAFSIRRADFEAVPVPEVSGQPTNVGKLIDFVAQGEQIYRGLGCIECHAIDANDTSVKTGPNLFGLMMLDPRDRVIVAGEGHRFTVKADRAYLHRSLRSPPTELAIAEQGPTQGQPYLPLMPPFLPTVLTDAQIDAIGSFLATLNEPKNQGPVVRLVEETGPKNYDPMTDQHQILVDRAVRIQRGPMDGLSGRSIHVGQPDGINYSFDPRVLAIAKIWQGGFLDTSGESVNRGGLGLKPGFESREIDLGPAGVLFAPLNAQGEPIDFAFKEAKFRDGETIAESLNSPSDHLDRLAAVNAQFLGYSRDSADPLASPTFEYRSGRNRISVQTEFSRDGQVRILVAGDFAEPQAFLINEGVLGPVSVSAGNVAAQRWTVPAGKQTVSVQGRLTLASESWRPEPSRFDYLVQRLAVEGTEATLPRGYRSEQFLSPKDNYGRDQLFEPLGLALAPDGTIVVATRTAGIWRLSRGEWRLFAEGLFDCLGIQVEDEHGFQLVAGQKAELTRITDTDRDGRADRFETLSDAFGFHGNYHAYLHGPARNAEGDYFVTLNLDDAGQLDYMYRAGGKYMGTSGGFRGWAARIPAAGGFEPWADGLRSPAGLAFGPDDRLWYADNQGEYFGTSKLFVLKKGGFYGHPAGLVDRPGLTPTSPELGWERVKAQREPAVVLFPQNRLANSPGNPAWDTTAGKFGPFANQLFIGDQTQSNLIRVVTEKVGAHEQGVAIPFGRDLQSGIMRPLFLADGSLLLGQTGRGWQAKGGRVASLQRLVWDGKTIPPAIQRVSAISGGFDVRLTVPLPENLNEAAIRATIAIKSWVYRDAPDYGSPELDEKSEPISNLEIGGERKSIRVKLAKTDQPQIHPDQTARVYYLTLAGKDLWGSDTPGFEAFYTLYEFPSDASSN